MMVLAKSQCSPGASSDMTGPASSPSRKFVAIAGMIDKLQRLAEPEVYCEHPCHRADKWRSSTLIRLRRTYCLGIGTRINAACAAIDDDGKSQRFIHTLPRKGIRFVGEVREEPKQMPLPATAVLGGSPHSPHGDEAGLRQEIRCCTAAATEMPQPPETVSGQTADRGLTGSFSASRNIRRAFFGSSRRRRTRRRSSWSRRRWRRTGDLGRRTRWRRRGRPRGWRRGHSGRWRCWPRHLRSRTRRGWRRSPAWWLSPLNLRLRPRRGLRNRPWRRCCGLRWWRGWRWRRRAWLSGRFRNDRPCFRGLNRAASSRRPPRRCLHRSRPLRSTGDSREIRGSRRCRPWLTLRRKFRVGIRRTWNRSRRPRGNRRRPFATRDRQSIGPR
jgi:hypothetical protein